MNFERGLEVKESIGVGLSSIEWEWDGYTCNLEKINCIIGYKDFFIKIIELYDSDGIEFHGFYPITNAGHIYYIDQAPDTFDTAEEAIECGKKIIDDEF